MQLSSEPAEELAKNLIESSNGAFEYVAFVSGGKNEIRWRLDCEMTKLIVGSEAMEAVVKMGCVAFCHTASQAVDHPGRRQYFLEVNQPKRTRYIARHLSYHGNTLGTLGLASHPTRKAPYHA